MRGSRQRRYEEHDRQDDGCHGKSLLFPYGSLVLWFLNGPGTVIRRYRTLAAAKVSNLAARTLAPACDRENRFPLLPVYESSRCRRIVNVTWVTLRFPLFCRRSVRTHWGSHWGSRASV